MTLTIPKIDCNDFSSAIQREWLITNGIGWGRFQTFDADEPHNPRGCIAQAWSVAELLRLARLVSGLSSEVSPDVEREATVAD